MDELGFYVLRYSVISEGWKGEHERLLAMKRLLGSERISPAARFEPWAPGRDPKLGVLSAWSLLLYYGYVLGSVSGTV